MLLASQKMNLLILIFMVAHVTSAKIKKVKTSTAQISVKTAEKVYDNSDDFLNRIIESEALGGTPTSPTFEDEVTEETVTESVSHTEDKRYAPQWSSLDTRPLPEWYDRAKVGIFIHWGVYSVPGFGSEWFWSNWEGGSKDISEFMNKTYSPGFTYQEFAPMFKAEFFDPNAWAQLFAKAGAKYVVLTSKHHDGFAMFPSRRSYSWNSVDIGPKRDIVGEVAQAVRNNGMKFGVYHSLYEWYNPIYLEDKKGLFLKHDYPEHKVWPDIKQLINDYKPSVLWSDGDWEAFDSYWNSTDLLAWLYNDSPVKDEIVVNDRWGIGIPCHHGDFYNCADRYNPGRLQNHKWENAFTVDSKSWGYRRNMDLSEILSINQLIKEVVMTVSCGGNALINVGPSKEGTIAPIFQERLLTLGLWLSINGEAIYDTSPWSAQNDTINPDVWYTCKRARYNGSQPTAPPQSDEEVVAIYAILLKWPADDVLKLENVANALHAGTYQIQMIGNTIGTILNWRINRGIAYIHLPNRSKLTSRHAWVLQFVRK